MGLRDGRPPRRECRRDSLDIGLPGLDGHEVASRIRESHPHPVCLVAITGYGQEGDRERTRAAGFAAHLVKPVDFAALQRVLAGLPIHRSDRQGLRPAGERSLGASDRRAKQCPGW
ncbi:MAG TPA: response regulator [Steroidobacteraceae bacterium]|jgi:CheY-like chemotaxis protein